MQEYAIVYGDLFEGIQGVVGPFKTYDKAEIYKDTHNMEHFESCIYELDNSKNSNRIS